MLSIVSNIPPSNIATISLLLFLVYDMKDPYAEYNVVKRSWIPQMHRRSMPIFKQNYNTPTNFRQGKESKDSIEFLPYDDLNEETEEYLPEMDESTIELLPVVRLLTKMRQESNTENYAPYRTSVDNFQDLLDEFDANEQAQDVNIMDALRNNVLENTIARNLADYPKRFTSTYNTPDNFRAGWESRDQIDGIVNDNDIDDELPESRIYFDENLPQENQMEEYGSGSNNNNNNQQEEIFRELKNDNFLNQNRDNRKGVFRELEDKNLYDLPVGAVPPEQDTTLRQPGIYAEGGVLYLGAKSATDANDKGQFF